MKYNILFTSYILLVFLTACDSTKKEIEKEYIDSTNLEINDSTAVGKANIQIEPLNSPNEFEDAILEWNQPNQLEKFTDNNIHFNYTIKNYQLTAPSKNGFGATHCAQSDKGQHIHLILNNEPYLAKYESDFNETLKDGHYVALSFLSKSYHESLKHYGASDIRQFSVGKKKFKDVDLNQPMLFYSRPKGEYIGKNAENVLLDFYVANVEIKDNAYKVKLTIDSTKVFFITNWQAYIIKNLPDGDHLIKIELIDPNGNLILGPFGSINRIIKINRST
jgi:hypothetical protein